MNLTFEVECDGATGAPVEAPVVHPSPPVEPAEKPGEDAPGSRLGLLDWRGLLALSGILAIAAWLDSGPVSLLAALMLAVGIVSRAWAGLSLVGLQYRRTLSKTRAFPGETVDLTATLDNRKFLPLSWARAEERLPRAIAPADPPLERTENKSVGRLGIATALGWYQSATATFPLVCRRRGYFLVGPSRVMSGDMFGLFGRARPAGPATPLIVYPKIYDLADLGLPSRQPFGAIADPQRLFEDPSRPVGLRDYTPDTAFKNIAWVASARLGRLQVKTFEPTVTVQTALFLAVDSFPLQGGAESFEIGISVVASLAHHMIELGQPVGVYANGFLAGGGGPLVLGAAAGDGQRIAALEGLAKLRHAWSSPFRPFLDCEAQGLSARQTIVVVAGRLSDLTVEHLIASRRRGHGVIVLIVGPGPMPEGRLVCRRIDGYTLGGSRT